MFLHIKAHSEQQTTKIENKSALNACGPRKRADSTAVITAKDVPMRSIATKEVGKRMNKKYKMRNLLVQYDDRNPSWASGLLEVNRKYAALYGYEYMYLTTGYDSISPFWRKVFLVAELLPFYDHVLWVDSDAAIVGTERLESLFGTHDFICSPNPPMLLNTYLKTFSAPFCAGVWGVKNSPRGHSIMKEWMNFYIPSQWICVDKKWSTRGVYGGVNYEQGAFEINIYRKFPFNSYIKSYQHWVLNHLPNQTVNDLCLSSRSLPQCRKDVFAVHYWSGNRELLKYHYPPQLALPQE